MKKLAKIIGLVGGIAALVWAMRDRFISVATSREPEPPRFRAVGDAPPLAALDGIGPVYEERLSRAGITSIASLAAASPDSVAEAAGVGVNRARDWIAQAQLRS